MLLNNFLWTNFTDSKNGQEWINFFSNLESLYRKSDPKLVRFIEEWINADRPHVRKFAAEGIQEVIDEIDYLNEIASEGSIDLSVHDWKDAETLFNNLSELVEDENEDNNIYSADDIPQLSIALYCLFPKYFFPYYFFPNFHALASIFQEFGIFLPPIPKKSDQEARFFYYLELCQSLHTFWSKLGFSPEHVPVFLYGFAPMVVNLRMPDPEVLPEPRRAWFIGGGVNNGDYAWLEKAGPKAITFWTGNKDTEIGDIVVMYCVAPKSIVHSIWRAVQPGNLEPFRHWTQTITIGFPQKVNPISFKALKADPILGNMPLIRSNLQGVNGKPITKDYYDRLLVLLKENGTDISVLPALTNLPPRNISLSNERDVEVHLLEPLLLRLGYLESDWQRQITVRVGRNEKAIPDYLIDVVRDKTLDSVQASWVWEAKYSISNNDQLKKDFAQVCSYARLVGAKGIALISKEGAWICGNKDTFSIKDAVFFSAAQLLEVDSLNQLQSIAGRRKRS